MYCSVIYRVNKEVKEEAERDRCRERCLIGGITKYPEKSECGERGGVRPIESLHFFEFWSALQSSAKSQGTSFYRKMRCPGSF